MPHRQKTQIEFDDEDAVVAEMGAELDIDPDELKLRSVDHFGVAAYEITIRGHGGGHKEWMVVENEDQAHELAVEIVKQDLENEPEIFNKDFIEQHINTDRLRRDLHSDVLDMNVETLQDRSPEEFWQEAESWGMDAPEEDEDGELPEPDRTDIEELANKQTDEQLRDPMAYLEDIYDDAVKKAIEIAGLDIDAAADEAVGVDGPGHFLSSYDGATHETSSGLVYWRVN